MMRRFGLLLLCLIPTPGCSSDAAPDPSGACKPGTACSSSGGNPSGGVSGGTNLAGSGVSGISNSGGPADAGGSPGTGGAVGGGGAVGTSGGGHLAGAVNIGGAVHSGGAVNAGGATAASGSAGAVGSGGGANLRTIPWEGGPAYWSKFPRAKAAGWTDPAFFPIGIWFEAVDNLPRLKSVGLNVYVGANHSSTDIAAFKSLSGTDGVFFIMNDEWSVADFGNNGKLAVGALASDEIDMLGQNPVSDQQSIVDAARNAADGRFVYSNYGKAALGTFWNPQNMPALVRMVDVASDDLYFFTDPNLPGEAPNSSAWPTGATVRRAASYGWTVERMRSFLASDLHPTWNFIEYSYPWGEPEPADGSKSMNPDKLAGAIWSSIIHEARGIILFNHAFEGARCGGQHVLVDCYPDMRARVTQEFANVKSVATILNTQSYEWVAASGIDSMLKVTPTAYYLFTQVGQLGTAGVQSLNLPGGWSGSVEVLFEGRSLTAIGGTLSDKFADTNVVHVYKMAR